MNNQNGMDYEANELFHRVFADEYENLLRYACAVLKRRDQDTPINGRAEDAVQEMFTLAWEHRREILGKERPVGWFYKALQYKIMELLKDENKWRKLLLRYKQLYIPPAEPNASLEFELKELVTREDFDLLHKLYWEGYSYREICQEMDLTKSALAAKVHRIKKKIRAELEK